MSFRNNLQHLRATRNMTQEQLAMLLGVSRQSVTKWEAEKSYPEMDKLIKMCDLFGCTLDELVSGDLTSVEVGTVVPMPSGPAADVCGYDEQMRKFADGIALGVGLIMLGVAGVPLFEFFFGEGGSSSATPLFAGVAAGLAFIIPAAFERGGFKREHPFIEDFCTSQDRMDDSRDFARGLVLGIGLILCSFALIPLSDVAQFENAVIAGMMAIWAVGAWAIVRAALLHGRLDVEAYNRSNADDMTVQELDGLGLTDEKRESLTRDRAARKRDDAVYGIIMLVATIVGLGMLFILGPNSAVPFWYAWVAGGLLVALYSCVASFKRNR